MSRIFFSATTCGFYPDDTAYENLPDDLVEVDESVRDKLISSITPGKYIGADKKGYPKLLSSPVEELTLDQVQQNRLIAYRSESDALFMEWQYDKNPESEEKWRDKVLEIKARHPLPSRA